MRLLLLFPVRFCVFVVGYVSYHMEVAADWFVGAMRRSEYARTGSCLKCGKCCKCLALMLPAGMASRHWLVRIVGRWHMYAMNFQPVGEEEGWLVYSCAYFREGSEGMPGRCSIYPFRHRLCRFFPRQRLYGSPSLHEDCGFRFVRRNVLDRRQKLRRKGGSVFDEVLAGKELAPNKENVCHQK